MSLLRRIANNPLFAQAVGMAAQQGIYLLGQWWLMRSVKPAPKESERLSQAIDRIDELIQRIERGEIPGTNGAAVSGTVIAKSVSSPDKDETKAIKIVVKGPKGEVKEEATFREDGMVEVTRPAVEARAANDDASGTGEPYSRYAPEMDVSAACLPCTKAHLAMVAGSLEEALRFAREDGVDHPEVEKRLAASAKDLVVLERYDLAPEKIRQAPPEEQKVIRELIPGIRKLRQDVLNRIHTAEDLERVAADAEELYRKARSAKVHKSIDWAAVEKQLFPEGTEEGQQGQAPAPEEPAAVEASPERSSEQMQTSAA